MEYCPSDIDRIIRELRTNGRRLTERGILNILVQSLFGLSYLHGINYMHRDIKPGNLLITCDGVTILGDLGLTKMNIDDIRRQQTLCGTPSYMAPEVLAKRCYNSVIDIWSLGTTIYELCTLIPLFTGQYHELYEKQKKGPVIPIPDIYSSQLKTIILHMLIYEECNRPTVDELLSNPYIKDYINNNMGKSYDNVMLQDVQSLFAESDSSSMSGVYIFIYLCLFIYLHIFIFN